MSEILRKLTSRKFLLSAVGVVSGIAMALGVDGNEITDVVQSVGGIVAAIASVVVYNNAEAKVDAAAVAQKDGQE